MTSRAGAFRVSAFALPRLFLSALVANDKKPRARRLKQTQTAVKSARKARQKRWFCFILLMIIIMCVWSQRALPQACLCSLLALGFR